MANRPETCARLSPWRLSGTRSSDSVAVRSIGSAGSRIWTGWSPKGFSSGEGTHIARPIYIDQLHPWLITIDDYVMLGPYVAIITHDASLNQHTGQTRIGPRDRREARPRRRRRDPAAGDQHRRRLGRRRGGGGTRRRFHPARSSSAIRPRRRRSSRWPPGIGRARRALRAGRTTDGRSSRASPRSASTSSAKRWPTEPPATCQPSLRRGARSCSPSRALVELAPARSSDSNPHGRPDGGRAAEQA